MSAASVRAGLGLEPESVTGVGHESLHPGTLRDVRFAAAAIAALMGRLPRQVALAALEFVLGPLAADPRRAGIQLSEPLFPLYSARRGDYRVVYRLVGELVLVLVVTAITCWAEE